MSIVTPIRNPHADRLEAERWKQRALALEEQLKTSGIEPTTTIAAPAQRAQPTIEQGQFGSCFVQMFRGQIPPGSRAMQFAAALNRNTGTNKAAQPAKALPQAQIEREDAKIIPMRQGEAEVSDAELRYAMIELT